MPKKPHSMTVIQTFPETITAVCPLLGEVWASSYYKICSGAIYFSSFDVINNFSTQTITKLVRLRVQSGRFTASWENGSRIVDNSVIFLTQTITKVCPTYSHLLLLSFLAETRSVSCLLTKPNEVIVLTWALGISSLCLSVTRWRSHAFTDCHDNSESTHLVRTEKRRIWKVFC